MGNTSTSPWQTQLGGYSCGGAAFLLSVQRGRPSSVPALLGLSTSAGTLNGTSGEICPTKQLCADLGSVFQVILKEKVKELNLHEVSRLLEQQRLPHPPLPHTGKGMENRHSPILLPSAPPALLFFTVIHCSVAVVWDGRGGRGRLEWV